MTSHSGSYRRDVFIGSTGPRDQPAFYTSMDNNLYKLKVVLIGDISVGKTSLAIRFTKNKFEETYKQTIGASFISKVAHVNDDVISFQIWDTAGQERYKSLVPMYLRGAQIALVLYDVTDPASFVNVNVESELTSLSTVLRATDKASFVNVNVWLEALRQHGDLVKTVLVGNKADLDSAVDDEEAEAFASDNGIYFMKASAKSGYNVDQVFNMMGSLVVEEMKAAEKLERQDAGLTLPRRPSKHDTLVLQSSQHTGTHPRRSGCCGRTRTAR